jgi:hypothetical protein
MSTKRKATTYNPNTSDYDKLEFKSPVIMNSCWPPFDFTKTALAKRIHTIAFKQGQKRKAETQTPGELVVATQLPAHVIQLVLKWAIWYRNYLYITTIRRFRRDAISIDHDKVDQYLYESQFINDE